MTLEWETALAESYKISDDEKTIIYTLPKDLKWSDGEPLTADDFVDAVNLIYLDEEVQTNSRNGLMPSGQATEWEKIDDYTLSVTFPFVYAGIFNGST
jgi:peptide/nickel transport system substrate-binding protein